MPGQDMPGQDMKVEVVVIGAGPAGSATAWHLARAGVPTLLVDKSDFPRDKVCGDCLSPRAQQVLGRMGLLDRVAAHAHQAPGIRFQAPGGARAEARIFGNGRLPDRTLVIPRQHLDHLLLQHAVAAGAHFRVAHIRALPAFGSKGEILLQQIGIRARMLVIATGAAIGLFKQTPLAPIGPVHSTAARCYVNGIADLDPELEFLFDHLPLPGYAWLFPTGPNSANVGFWYSGRKRLSAAAQLPRLLGAHPWLSQRLAQAHDPGPMLGFPIRTDFLRAPKIGPGLLCVGEAAGLVNPFTGEGIDYALESAELAAAVIFTALSGGGGMIPQAALRAYPRALNQQFRNLFVLMELMQRHVFNAWVFDRLFGRGEQGQQLVDRLIQVCFGAAPPWTLLHPWQLSRLLLSRPSATS
jgi:geranylgeranyl reductase family protein